MRTLVITVLFALLARTAGAETPLALQRCIGPYDCVTINTGPCGSFMTNDRGGLTPGVTAQVNPNFPRIQGVCGFYEPPFYAQERASRVQLPSDSGFPPIPAYNNPP